MGKRKNNPFQVEVTHIESDDVRHKYEMLAFEYEGTMLSGGFRDHKGMFTELGFRNRTNASDFIQEAKKIKSDAIVSKIWNR